MNKITSNRVARTVLILSLMLIISISIAIPVFIRMPEWSMKTAKLLYAKATEMITSHSPSMVKIDEKGIPLVNYSYQKGTYIGEQRNPLTIATKAISYYDEYKSSNDKKLKQYFTNCIKWLDENKIDKTDYFIWHYNFDLPTYKIKAPWYSAMAQARIMVAFQRAYSLTADPYYLDIAFGAMNSLSVRKDQGGTVVFDPADNGIWFEEVIKPGTDTSPRILNGNIFVLLDLYDFYLNTNINLAKSLFDEGISELKRHLADYDTGRWTYYDSMGNLAYDYHYVHIEQMKLLYDITHDNTFKFYHDRWKSYFPLNPLWARERFAGIMLSIALVFAALSLTYCIFMITKLSLRKIKLNKQV